MHIWTLEGWKKYYHDGNVRHGMRLYFDKDIDSRVKESSKAFCKWMRTRYYFPIRVSVYIKNMKRIKTFDNKWAFGTFFEPGNRYQEPYIRIAAGDYLALQEERGREEALAEILLVIAHELTHYFQWINDISLTDVGMERQATSYSKRLVFEYTDSMGLFLDE